jgi:flagellar protein FlaF
MASAEIIGAAIGILLMMIVAYLLVGSTLTAAEIVTTAQKDVTLQNEARLRTDINISSIWVQPLSFPPLSTFRFYLNNTGSEIIGDFSHMDIFSLDSTSQYKRYTYSPSGSIDGKWTIEKIDPDVIHPKMLDPGEGVWICATYTAGPNPVWILVSTGNGVYKSRYI